MRRLPAIPPTLDTLLGSLGPVPGELMEKSVPAALGWLRDQVPLPTVRGRYLHWDELRRRPPPDGLTREEWWFGLKLARGRGTTVPGMRAVNGQERFSVATTVGNLQAQLHMLDMRAAGSIRAPGPLQDAASKQQYLLRSMIEEAISSSIIEGASSTREVARRMLREGRAPRDRSERMIVNNYVTMQRIAELTEEPMSEKLLLELHALVTTGTLDNPDAVGRMRTEADPEIAVVSPEGFVAHEPPPPRELPARLLAMLAFANSDAQEPFVHPVVRSIILHFWLAYDHPFVDGNGRTARALFYWSMLHHGYWLLQYVSISEFIARAPMRYARAFLHTETDDFDLTYFVLHQLDVLERAIDALHIYLDQSVQRTQAAELSLDDVDGLNHRQRSLLAAAIRRPSETFTTEGHRRTHGITYPTAHADMKGLMALGLVTRRRVGKQYRYRAVPGLTEQLRALGQEHTAARSQ